MAKISQKLSLSQTLSPKQLLQASLLQLNLPLLEQRILHELETNPALELVDLGEDLDQNLDEKVDSETEFEWEELLGINDEYEYPKSIHKNEEFEAPLVSKETFVERLIKQLQDNNMNTEGLQVAEQVLGNLDDQGYLTIEPELISDRMGIDELRIEEVIKQIQRLDPPGLAARDIRECLLVQAEVRNENSVSILILKEYFDDFVNHRYEKIIEKIDCSKDELNEALEFISRLDPSPKNDQAFDGYDTIIPDVSVESRDGSYYVVVQDSTLPDIRVSPNYIKMLEKHKDEKEVKEFVKTKLDSANWFVEAVEQRKQTIQIVMESIIKYQSDYFTSEDRKLKPMILKNIADDIGLDISTVSRVTNGKYVQLPWEIKELKTFFTEGVETKKGDLVSNSIIKNRLLELLDNEDKFNPLSDEELSELLNKDGYKIARRTVAKYREQLKFSTARLRRKVK